MATAELMPPPEDYLRTRTGLSGAEITMNPGPTQATDEQNQRVQMILDALRRGVSPESQGVPNAQGLTPVPGSAPGQPFGLQGYQGAQGGGAPQRQLGPSDNKQALLQALRSNPQETIQAMQGLNQQLKGMPSPAQQMIYEGLGIGDPEKQQFDSGTVGAAASGMRVPGGMTQPQARGIQANQREVQHQSEVDRANLSLEVKASTPLTPQQMATLYKWDPALGRVSPFTGTGSLTAQQAQQQGYRSVNPKLIQEAQSIADAVNLQFTLLKGAVEAAKDKNYPQLQMSFVTGGSAFGQQGINLYAATHDFALQWDKLIGGVRAAASPMFLAAMKARLPEAWDSPATREQKLKLLEPAVRALQQEKLTSVMGLPPDPRIRAGMKAALQGLGLNPQLVQQYVDESGGVPDRQAPDPTPVAPRNDNVVEFGGVPYIREGPGRYRPLVPGQSFDFNK